MNARLLRNSLASFFLADSVIRCAGAWHRISLQPSLKRDSCEGRQEKLELSQKCQWVQWRSPLRLVSSREEPVRTFGICLGLRLLDCREQQEIAWRERLRDEAGLAMSKLGK